MATRRRRGTRNQTRTLHGRVQRKSSGKGLYQVGAILFLVTVLAGALGVIWLATTFVKNVFFVGNDRFRIETIEISEGRIKTESLIREYLAYIDIKAGENIFSFDIESLVTQYLERNPLVRSMRVSRRLPGTLVVEVRERNPLARLGQRGSLVVDSEGMVFRAGSDLHSLPVIIGNRDAELAPGRTVEGMSQAAIAVLAACDNPRIGLRVVGVDVGHGDYLRLHVLTSDGIKEAKLSWEQMGQDTDVSRQDLLLRLAELSQVAMHDREGHLEYNVTIPGRVFAR